MLSVWGWAASAWHLALWLSLWFRRSCLKSNQILEQPNLSIACGLWSEATEASGLDSAGDAGTLSPCSVESDSWDASTALSWDMEAEKEEALDPARLGTSPSSAPFLIHLDFACRDGAMATPAAVFYEEQGSAVVPFRNVTEEPLSLTVELVTSESAEAVARDVAAWEPARRRLRPGEAFVPEPPSVRLEPASGQLGPGEEGRLTLRLKAFARAVRHGCLVHVELRSRTGEEERLVEIPLVKANLPRPTVQMTGEKFMRPHSRRPVIPFTVHINNEQMLWVRFSRSALAEVDGLGTWFLVGAEGRNGSLRLLSPGSGDSVYLGLGEAIEASQGDFTELSRLQGEELASRTQVLANLAFHSRPPEMPIAGVYASVQLSRDPALATEPMKEVGVPKSPASSAVRLRNRSRLHSLFWAAEVPPYVVCEPSAGLLGPLAEAELRLRHPPQPQPETWATQETESVTQEGSEEGGEEEDCACCRLVLSSGYAPPEELDVVANDPGHFLREELRLLPDHIHLTSLQLISLTP